MLFSWRVIVSFAVSFGDIKEWKVSTDVTRITDVNDTYSTSSLLPSVVHYVAKYKKFAQLMKIFRKIRCLDVGINMRSLSKFVINLLRGIILWRRTLSSLALSRTWSSTKEQANTPVVAHGNLFSDISAS